MGMKSVLISIQPKWCELIANGKKAVEVRKTKPKLDTPFKVYIYCTKAKQHFSLGGGVYATNDTLYRLPTGEVKFGDGFELIGSWVGEYDENNFLNGKVIGEFVCNQIDTYDDDTIHAFSHEDYSKWNDFDLYNSCVHPEDFERYANDNWLYGWHISNLIIYDKPKELSEFYTVCKLNCEYCEMWGSVRVNAEEFDMDCKSDWFNHKPLTRPFQSWGYVYEAD